jgi:hypothetical protein
MDSLTTMRDSRPLRLKGTAWVRPDMHPLPGVMLPHTRREANAVGICCKDLAQQSCPTVGARHQELRILSRKLYLCLADSSARILPKRASSPTLASSNAREGLGSERTPTYMIPLSVRDDSRRTLVRV